MGDDDHADFINQRIHPDSSAKNYILDIKANTLTGEYGSWWAWWSAVADAEAVEKLAASSGNRQLLLGEVICTSCALMVWK